MSIEVVMERQLNLHWGAFSGSGRVGSLSDTKERAEELSRQHFGNVNVKFLDEGDKYTTVSGCDRKHGEDDGDHGSRESRDC